MAIFMINEKELAAIMSYGVLSPEQISEIKGHMERDTATLDTKNPKCAVILEELFIEQEATEINELETLLESITGAIEKEGE